MINIEENYNLNKENLRKIECIVSASTEAIQREKEIREQILFYTISISEEDKQDIKILNEVKDKLKRPEVLSKLI